MFEARRLRVQLPAGELVEKPPGTTPRRLLTPIVERKGCHPWTPIKRRRAPEEFPLDPDSLPEAKEQLKALQKLIDEHLKGIEAAENALKARAQADP